MCVSVSPGRVRHTRLATSRVTHMNAISSTIWGEEERNVKTDRGGAEEEPRRSRGGAGHWGGEHRQWVRVVVAREGRGLGDEWVRVVVVREGRGLGDEWVRVVAREGRGVMNG